MKKQAGFTLIELVIVIIILGILAATAVPKFINLQSDARASALDGVKGALEGAASIVYSKAAIDGLDKIDSTTLNSPNGDIAIVYGYPSTTSVALSTAANLDSTDWIINGSAGALGSSATIYSKGTVSGSTATCQVTYTLANTSDARPTITVDATGC